MKAHYSLNVYVQLLLGGNDSLKVELQPSVNQ